LERAGDPARMLLQERSREMARPLWKGAISFGMVSIPVRLYTATEEKDVRFNQLHAEDKARIRQKRFCSEEDVEVDLSEIVKGYEVTPGHYVILEDEDLEKVPVNTTHTIEITDFVSLSEIDPILYQKTYYLEPEEIGHKPFALLMRALQDSERVAIAKVTLRQKEQLCSLRLYENTIALETMFYDDEVRSTQELNIPDAEMELSDRELAMAKSLVEMLTTEFDYSQYKDNYREALMEIIRKKAEGEVIEAPAPVAAKITDLTEALRASVEAVRKQRAGADRDEESRPRERAKAS
jgi:DNA end-binding protein Ku